jgi:hypothetical protein
MRKREYENVLISYFGSIPEATPVLYFRACLDKFKQMPILTAQDLTYRELKKRSTITKTDFESVMPELKSIVYFSNLSRMLPDIEQLLQSTYRR